MEDILTLYPQLLSLFQEAGIKMPQDPKTTTIGALCEEAGVDADTLIEKCDAKLRKE